MATSLQNKLREHEVRYFDNSKKLIMSAQDVIDEALDLQQRIYALKNELSQIARAVKEINTLRNLEQEERDERNRNHDEAIRRSSEETVGPTQGL